MSRLWSSMTIKAWWIDVFTLKLARAMTLGSKFGLNAILLTFSRAKFMGSQENVIRLC